MKEIVVFNLGQEQFGIEIEYVLEIIRKQKVTKIPTKDKYLLGLINIRDKVRNVFDLSKFLEIKNDQDVDKEYYIICIDKETDKELVFPISNVKKILKITDENKISVQNKEFISDNVKYVVREDSNLITVLNFEKIIKEL